MEYQEEKLQETISISKAAFYAGEAEQPMTQLEFLMQQSHYIKKRWWFLQGALLALLFWLLGQTDSDLSIQRALGSAGPLFAILMLPELWKNRACGAMEVESAAYYSLRQIYAARMTLFAGVDLLLISGFFLGIFTTGRLGIWDALVQFLLPTMVTCCICFQCLYTIRAGSEAFALLLCSLWTGLWIQLVLNDTIYNAISVPVWCMLLAASLTYLLVCIALGQKKWRDIWEVKPIWN